MKLDVESLLTGLRSARHETIVAWTTDLDVDDVPRHLLNALLDVELAITALEKCDEHKSSEFRGMVAATQGRPVEQ